MEFFHHAESWVLVAFILFIALLVYLKVPAKVAAMLDDRANKIASELSEAKRLREEAQALLAEYQKKRVDAERDAVNIIEQAKREAEAFAVEARAKLSETLDRRSRQAEQKIAQAEAQAVKEVRNIATDLAVAAAGHLIGATAKGDAGNRLIEEGISQVKSKLN
jgi:F-type H+-transporting ATPase subunit b